MHTEQLEVSGRCRAGASALCVCSSLFSTLLGKHVCARTGFAAGDIPQVCGVWDGRGRGGGVFVRWTGTYTYSANFGEGSHASTCATMTAYGQYVNLLTFL